MCTSCACARKYAPSPLSLLLPSPSHTHTHTYTHSRKREEQLKDELRKASEEKEPLLRRGSNKDEKSPRARRESSTSSDKIHLEEAVGPSICPATVIQSWVFTSIYMCMYAMFYRGIPWYVIAIGRSRERSVCRGLQC